MPDGEAPTIDYEVWDQGTGNRLTGFATRGEAEEYVAMLVGIDPNAEGRIVVFEQTSLAPKLEELS